MSVDNPVFTDLTDTHSKSGDIKEIKTIQLYSKKQGKNELIHVDGTIVGKPVTILLDGSSTHNFISK